MVFSKSKVFVILSLSFALGVLIASRFNIPRIGVYVFLGILVCIAQLLFFTRFKKISLLAIFLFVLCLGILRLQISMHENHYQDLLGSRQEIEAYVIEDPDVRANTQLLTILPKGESQRILVTTTLAQEFFYGDKIVANGKVEEVKNFNEFDYEKYLERHNVYATLKYPKILILKSHELNPIKEKLLLTKKLFASKISELFSEPENSLLLGILIGAKKALPKDIIENFNRTGTSHIIAVSGFNITIIISALASLAYLIGRRSGFYFAIFAIVAFVVITGGSASVIRASIMGFLLLLSMYIGRQYSITPAIFFSGLVMLIINPKVLYWDVGFQLSFAATLGIIYFLPVLKDLTEKFSDMMGIKMLLITTLSAIISTTPIILLNFGSFSFSAPLANVFVLPLVPPAMLFGFLSILPILGPGFAFIAKGFLVSIISTVGFFAGLPYSSINFKISIWIFWLLVVLVFVLYFALKYWLIKLSNKFE